MESTSVNQFRDNLKGLVDRVARNHVPLKITRRGGEDFVVVSAEDWEREQETLFILQNHSLMRQIADSVRTHEQQAGYRPTTEETNAILGV